MPPRGYLPKTCHRTLSWRRKPWYRPQYSIGPPRRQMRQRCEAECRIKPPPKWGCSTPTGHSLSNPDVVPISAVPAGQTGELDVRRIFGPGSSAVKAAGRRQKTAQVACLWTFKQVCQGNLDLLPVDPALDQRIGIAGDREADALCVACRGGGIAPGLCGKPETLLAAPLPAAKGIRFFFSALGRDHVVAPKSAVRHPATGPALHSTRPANRRLRPWRPNPVMAENIHPSNESVIRTHVGHWHIDANWVRTKGASILYRICWFIRTGCYGHIGCMCLAAMGCSRTDNVLKCACSLVNLPAMWEKTFAKQRGRWGGSAGRSEG